MEQEKISLLLVDDHALVREGLRLVLSAQSDLEVVAEAANGPEGLDLVRQHRPDIVLMDITMPGMNGIEATRAIVAMNFGVRVLGLTIHENPEYFFRMLAAGASGYVLKGATSAELMDAIRAVHRGGVYMSSGMASHMVGEYLRYRDKALKAGVDGLTAREVQVLQLIAKGYTNQQVAEALHLSVYTVQTHRAHIMRKLGLENWQQLIKYAVDKGYLDQEPSPLPSSQ